MSIDQAAMNFINQHNAMKIAKMNADISKYGIDTRAGLEQQNIEQRKKLFDMVTMPQEERQQYAQTQLEEDIDATDLARKTDILQKDRQATYEEQLKDVRKLIAPEFQWDDPGSYKPFFKGIPNRIWDMILGGDEGYGRPDRPVNLDPERRFIEAGGSPEEWDKLQRSGQGINIQDYIQQANNADLMNELKASGFIGNVSNPLGGK